MMIYSASEVEDQWRQDMGVSTQFERKEMDGNTQGYRVFGRTHVNWPQRGFV